MKDKALGKLLWFDALASPRVVINKDSALMACLKFRGPDLHSEMDTALVVQATQLNNLIRRFESGWGLMSECRRREVREYSESAWPCEAARLVDDERRALFQESRKHYISECYFTLTQAAKVKQVGKWQRHLYANLPDDSEEASVSQFETDVRRVVALLGECTEEVEWLEGEALLTYLHDCVSWKLHQVAVPEPACYLDTYLTDSDLDMVWCLPHLCRYPTLGGQYIRCVSVKAYPKVTNPGMLDVLDNLPMEYRACVRFLPIARSDAVREAQKYRDAHRGRSKKAEQVAANYAKEASEFQAGVEHGTFSSGAITQTVVVWGETFEEATWKAERVEQALNDANYVAKVETINTLAAWDGTLPGNTYSNARKPLLTSQNMSHIFPATTQTRGPAWNNHLGGPPLLKTIGRGQTPFHLDLHDGDVAHTMIIGPTGTGKSMLVALIACQWLKYKDAQVYLFDKDQSARAVTYAVGGAWFDLAEELTKTQGGGLDDSHMNPWGALWTPQQGWFQTFETASLLSTPAIIPQVLSPLLHAIEARLTGAPTLIVLDEAWTYLKNDFFSGKIQDWLLTLRKKNAAVLFSTQSLEHIVASDIGMDIYQSCVTRIFLSNKRALEPGIGKLYSDIGLSDRQREIIATLARKRQYYYQGAHGHCVFELGVGPITLAYCGSGTKEDLRRIEEVYTKDPYHFAQNWLEAKGVTYG